MALDGRQITVFHDKGFILLKSFFDVEVMAKVAASLDEIRDRQSDKGREAGYYEKSAISNDNILVRTEYILGDHNLELTGLLLSDETMECLGQLFGDTPVLFKDKINYKLPGCRADRLHQDQAAGWNSYSDFFISMCIVVDANRKENAAMSFMSSGNYEKNLMTDNWEPLDEGDLSSSPGDEYTLLEADPGDVVFFDSYVPHGSPANTGDKQRRNIFLTFNRLSDGDMRDRYYRDKWRNYAPNNADNARPEESFLV